MPPLVNPLPYVFIFATAFGVLTHDTQVDKATSMAVMTPASFTNVALADAVAKSNEHVHVERTSVSSQGSSTHPEKVPKTQVRNDYGKYVQVKKNAHDGGDRGLWPSV